MKATKTHQPDAWTVYDALGNRVGTKINDVWQFMIYDAFGKLVAEYGVEADGTGGVKYVQQDWQGSVRAVTNSNGFVVARTDHQAFGEEIGVGVGLRAVEQGYSADKATRQGYGLTENDSTGLNHTWFRKNENRAGRWTSPDPYKGSMSLGDPQSFNRYAYVTGDPINFVDPSGLDGLGDAVGLAQELLKNPACRKAVDSAKGVKADLGADLGRIYKDGKISLRADVRTASYRNGRLIEGQPRPFGIRAGATWHYQQRAGGAWIPFHISLNQNSVPFNAADNSRFGAYTDDTGQPRGDMSRLESMALMVLHEYRHWRGDRDNGANHDRKFNSLINLFCFTLNPFNPNRDQGPLEISPTQPSGTVIHRQMTPLPGGGGSASGGGDSFRSLSWLAFEQWANDRSWLRQ